MLSLTLSFLLFAVTFFSVYSFKLFKDDKTKPQTASITENTRKSALFLLFLEEDVSAAWVNFDFAKFEVKVEDVDTQNLTQNDLENMLVKKESDNEIKFVKFTEENFLKFTDKSGGIVYSNNITEKSELLLGNILLEKITPQLFCKFLRQHLSRVLENTESLKEQYIFLVNNVDTNISYINYYDAYENIKKGSWKIN